MTGTSKAEGAAAGRPLPEPDEQSAPYWEAAARHELTIARCSVCEGFTMPPDVVCPRCGSTDPGFAFVSVDGRGTICSWTVLRQAFLPGFDVPFVLVDVALDAAPDVRLVGRLLDGPEATIEIADRVEVAFEDLGPGVAVPAFRLVER